MWVGWGAPRRCRRLVGYMPGAWPQGHRTGDDRGVCGFVPVAERADGAWRWPGRITTAIMSIANHVQHSEERLE